VEGYNQTYWLHGIIIGVLLLSAIPAQLDYYHWPKSNARSVSELIQQKWKSGDMILVAPGYQARIYDYYLRDVYRLNEIAMSVKPTEIDQLPLGSAGHKTFLVYAISFANPLVSARNDLGYIKGVGYKPILLSKEEYGFHSLFIYR